MKKVMTVMSGAVMGVLLNVSLSFAGGGCATISQLANQIPFPLGAKNAKIVSEKKISSDVCSVIVQVKNGRLVPLFYIKDKGVVIGGMFQNRMPVTNMEIRKLNQRNLKTAFKSKKIKELLSDAVMAEYKPKNAVKGKVLYAFVDPLCPFCRMAEKQLKQIANNTGTTVKLMPFIVHGKPAQKDAIAFICNHKTFNDWIKNDYGKVNPEDKACLKATKILRSSLKIVEKMHFGGTPTFITGNGQIVEGANIPLLKKVLSK